MNKISFWQVAIAVAALALFGYLANPFKTGITVIDASQAAQGVTPEYAKSNFAALPKTADSVANPSKPEKVALGKALYFDPRLSKSGFISCNSCHNLATAGVDSLPTSIGHRWQIGPRNAPTVLNVALHNSQFWDGRAKDVEDQAGKPVLNPGEMASTEQLVLSRLESIPQYVEMFKNVFIEDQEPLNYNNVARAIAAFERTLLTPSRFDKFIEGNADALTEKEKAGMKTFVSMGCSSCHNGALLGGNSFQKFGVVKQPAGLTDKGRAEVTKNNSDLHVFKVPSLRNIALTAPYFHDGKTWSLAEAIKVMADVQLGKQASDAEVQLIVAFLNSLNGDPALQVTLPVLPPSTDSTAKPAFD